MWPNGAPIPAPPQIDFSREMIAFVALGERATGGFTILVDSAATTSSGVVIWVGTVSPGSRCGTTQAFTQPVDIARLPRIDAAVHFVDVVSASSCP
jgi:protease stability complex PrcB-like protein